MLEIVPSNRFKRSFKRMKRRGKDVDKIEAVIDKLANEKPLDSHYEDHSLTGN